MNVADGVNRHCRLPISDVLVAGSSVFASGGSSFSRSTERPAITDTRSVCRGVRSIVTLAWPSVNPNVVSVVESICRSSQSM